MTTTVTTSTGRRFDDRVALVTGAGSGIGRAIALRLATEGARVFGHDIAADPLAETVALVERANGTMRSRVGDISRRDECRALVDDCVAAFGRLDVAGNVAGIARAEHFVDVSEADYRRMMGVNVDGPTFVAQAAIPHLLATGGTLINIASNAGLMGQAYTVVYCMTKGAIVQLTRALAMEFVRSDIRINAIAPAGVLTSLTTGFTIPPDVDGSLMVPYSGYRGIGSPEDIAALFAWMASDEAANMHGSIVSSDRGVTAG
jgi:NAD(P)-dependent dehydrogenase (short-subunit alcohol dehydrogenase family)